MTILKTNQTNHKADQFKQAADLWNLERLYADLATIKGDELTETEKLHLRGLLCGYNSSTLAEKLYKSTSGLRSEVSKYVNHYIKDLINQRQGHSKKPVKKLKSGDVLKWLEELGYKKPTAVSSNGLTIQIDTAGGTVKIINKLVEKENRKLIEKDRGRITFEISNSRVIFSLPTEEFSKLLAQSEENEVEGEVEK